MTFTSEELQGVGELVSAAQNGDREAWGKLIEQFYLTVFAIALRRVRNYHDAQDLTQDVFVQAGLHLHQLREPSRFAGWLKTTTHRMTINRLVRCRPELPISPETLSTFFTGREEDPASRLLREEEQAMVVNELNQMPEFDRQTLTDYYYGELSMEGMSVVASERERRQVPVGTIKRRLHVARKRLAIQVTKNNP